MPPPGETRAALLPHLTSEWTAPGALAAAAGVSASACTVALRALAAEGGAEHNGERATASRWRAKVTRARHAAQPKAAARRRGRAPMPVDEDDDDIDRDGPFRDEEDDS